MPNILGEITSFIENGRNRYESKHGNMFAFSWGHVARYREYLEIIHERYMQVSAEFVENQKAYQSFIKPGTHPVGPELMAVMEKGARITSRLHLEIETTYLFAKILLDKVAHAVSFFFGPGRGVSFVSHNSLMKCFEEYAQQKGLIYDSKIIELQKQCQKEISDFRDDQIAHETSPRTMRGTMFSLNNTAVRMSINRIYPVQKDAQTESKELTELLTLIDIYIKNILDFVEANQDKTDLETVPSAGFPPVQA